MAVQSQISRHGQRNGGVDRRAAGRTGATSAAGGAQPGACLIVKFVVTIATHAHFARFGYRPVSDGMELRLRPRQREAINDRVRAMTLVL